jgi:CRISPR-associated protein Cas1
MDAATSPNEVSTMNDVETPEYLPARMLNEFVYCPRLFYYMWVEGVFVHNRETVEGSLRHAKLDDHEDGLLPAAELTPEDTLHSRSVELSSDAHGLIAKMDLIEVAAGTVTPVDYKRGAPRKNGGTGQLEAWDTDRVQLAVQAIILREHGYTCTEGVIYYVTTKQRVRVAIDDALVSQTLQALADARAVAASERIPAPLVDSPKCPRCSLVGICLPDETLSCRAGAPETGVAPQRTLFDIELPLASNGHASAEPRRLVAARDDLRPLYLNTQGLYVGKSGNVLKVKEKDKVVQEVRIGETCQVNLFGNIQISTQAVQALCEGEVPIAYFSMGGGWFYGVTHGLGVRNVYLRREQFRLAEVPAFCLRLARTLVSGKLRNQRTMLQRNHVEPPAGPISFLKCMQEQAESAETLEELLGIEGSAARVYFEQFAGMIKVYDDDQSPAGSEPEFTFDFLRRNRRPPRDPVNALLSLAYSVLAKDLTIVCHAVGFDPYLGFYHQPRFGRAALALDLMEPFRPLVADSAVLSAINTRMITTADFVRTGDAVALRSDGRKAFFRAYEQRMDTLVTHPVFGYRVNYRRLLEIQARLLARVLTGEIATYPVFVTR